MGVDEAGQQRRIAEIDDFRAVWNAHGALAADRNDAVIGHDDYSIHNRGCARSVDETRRAEHNRAGSARFLLRFDERRRAGEEPNKRSEVKAHLEGCGVLGFRRDRGEQNASESIPGQILDDSQTVTTALDAV
jgi:hypothetical protein